MKVVLSVGAVALAVALVVVLRPPPMPGPVPGEARQLPDGQESRDLVARAAEERRPESDRVMLDSVAQPAVVRGRCVDAGGSPLAGVTVTAKPWFDLDRDPEAEAPEESWAKVEAEARELARRYRWQEAYRRQRVFRGYFAP